MPAFGAVLFDLDGTLLDTAPDMAAALNGVRGEHGLTPLEEAALRPVVSGGAPALIRAGFGVEAEDLGYDALRESFLEQYQRGLSRRTRLFPGMETVLTELEARRIPWGVVTNKPAWLTEPLLAAVGLEHRLGCAVSGDTTAHSKPHPAPVLHACELLGVEPGRCLLVGDDARDAEAGGAAGVTVLVALYGYIPSEARPRTWGARGSVERPEEILEWLEAS